MNEQMRKRFIELKVTGQRCAIPPEEKREKDLQLIKYLKSVIKNNEVAEFEDIGFCYWNISDNYALLREGYSLFLNHQAFYEHIKTGNPYYLYWLVCDATQRLTLEKDGYSDFWWSLYRETIEQNSNNNYYFAQFNAHRAALYINPVLPHIKHNLEYAKRNFEKFLQKIINSPEYPFYKIIYLSLASRFFTFDKKELKKLCEDLFNGLSHPETTNNFLAGEWQSFITPFNVRKQAVVGITSAINAFISNGDLQTAKELYGNACDMGLPKNYYIETRLK